MKSEINPKIVVACIGLVAVVIAVFGFLQFGPSMGKGPEIEAPIPEGWVKDPKTGNIVPPFANQPSPPTSSGEGATPKKG